MRTGRTDERKSAVIGYSIFYDARRRSRDECRVRIAFDRELLRERDNDFARTTLEALREAKGMLRAGAGGVTMQEAMKEWDEKEQIGCDTA